MKTLPSFFVEEDKIIAALFAEGLDLLHIDKPDADGELMERLLSLLPERVLGRVFVRGHHRLARDYGLGGITLDWGEPLPEGYKGGVARSCTDPSYAREAGKKAAHVLLGGVFGGPGESLQAYRDAAAKRVYAMGGITPETAAAARKAGFGGVVAEEDVWSRFDMHTGQDFKPLLERFAEIRRVAG